MGITKEALEITKLLKEVDVMRIFVEVFRLMNPFLCIHFDGC